jgi:hypothetical protein
MLWVDMMNVDVNVTAPAQRSHLGDEYVQEENTPPG